MKRIKLKKGYVMIEGCDNASGFTVTCKETELQEVGKAIFSIHSGENGYYNFTKFLWVQYADGRGERRLDDIVSYSDEDTPAITPKDLREEDILF